MPKLGFVINSKFDPTSIADYSKIFDSYVDTYKDYEQRYQTLIDSASTLEKLQKNDNDTEAYNRYKDYLNGVEELANGLATNGWDRNKDIAGAMKARKDYMQIIKPIEEAYETREKLAEEQRKLLAQDPTRLFDTDMSNVSVDTLIGNPGTYKSYSGALLTSQVGDAAKNLAREVKENPRKWRTILGNQYYETLMQSGFTSNQILAAMAGNLNAAPELNKIINDVMDSSGIASWGNDTTTQRARDYAMQGLWNAIGSIKYDTLANRIPTDDGSGTSTESALAINPVNIYSTRKVQEDRNENKIINKLFTKDPTTGKITFSGRHLFSDSDFYTDDSYADFDLTTKVGRRLYMKSVLGDVSEEAIANKQGTEFVKSINAIKFAKLANALQPYLPKDITIKDATDEQIISAYEQYSKEYEAIQNGSYDAHKETAYQFNLASSNQKDVKNSLLTGMKRSGKLQGVDYNPDTNELDLTGDDLSSTDFNDDKVQVTSLEMSPYGIIVNVNVDGEMKQFKLPESVNAIDQEAVIKTLSLARDYSKMIYDGYFINEDTGEKIYLNDEQKMNVYADYLKALNDAHIYAANIAFVNDTQAQKFQATGH